MKSVYCLTLKTLLRSLKTYIYFAVTLIATGGFFTYVNLSNGYSGVEYSIEFLEIALLLTLPLISAELFTADRQCGFEKTLLTYGITTEKLFFGKLLAAITVFLMPQLLLLAVPPIFEIFGIVNYLSAYATIFAFLLLGVSIMSVGAFISLTAKSTVSSYVCSFVTFVFLYLFTVFAGAVPQTRQISLLVLTAFLVAISVVIYVFTRSWIVFGGVFCITEGIMILLYFAVPKLFAGALSTFFKLISPCASLNSVIYGPYDLTALVHIILITAVFVLLSVLQFKRRKYE